MNQFDVIVIGAGPAGLLAAGRAAELGANVLLLEKMRSAGRKLLITGKGRCNITNDASPGEFVKQINPDGRFLRNAFSRFFSGDIIDLLNKQGVESVLERGGRYFPASNRSADVLNALLKWIESLRVDIRFNQQVGQILTDNNRITGVISNGIAFTAPAVIIATGGKSYPATGSTGDGYHLAANAGHTIIKPAPALVPLETRGDRAQRLQGLNLKNVKASVWVNGKKEGDDFGEMIFTHFGLSGPIILTLSRLVVAALQKKERVEISIDLKPALDEQKLDSRLLRDLNEHGKMQLDNIFRQWLPASMIPVFLETLNLDPAKLCHQVTSTERKNIRFLLKNLKFEVINHRTYKEAIITSGGVDIKEISPKTMESKKVRGLYFAGEILDVDGKTGGYNLQIAWSTGWLAGDSSVNNG